MLLEVPDLYFLKAFKEGLVMLEHNYFEYVLKSNVFIYALKSHTGRQFPKLTDKEGEETQYCLNERKMQQIPRRSLRGVVCSVLGCSHEK